MDIANHIIEERLTWPVRAVMLGSAGLYGQLLPDQGFFKAPYPARAAVEVARLPKDVLVEIKVTALVE